MTVPSFFSSVSVAFLRTERWGPECTKVKVAENTNVCLLFFFFSFLKFIGFFVIIGIWNSISNTFPFCKNQELEYRPLRKIVLLPVDVSQNLSQLFKVAFLYHSISLIYDQTVHFINPCKIWILVKTKFQSNVYIFITLSYYPWLFTYFQNFF